MEKSSTHQPLLRHSSTIAASLSSYGYGAPPPPNPPIFQHAPPTAAALGLKGGDSALVPATPCSHLPPCSPLTPYSKQHTRSTHPIPRPYYNTHTQTHARARAHTHRRGTTNSAHTQ